MNAEAQGVKTTPLHALHVELGATLTPFAGYEMPVRYPLGILKEHLHTRDAAGLFDVSHMGQIRLEGEGAAEALERLVPIDVLGLGVDRQRYGLFTDESGGILDDLMVTRGRDHLHLVVNAACKAADLAHLQQRIGSDCRIEMLEDRALLALQGPKAARVMGRLAPPVARLPFMHTLDVELMGIPCLVSRSGYSGEDGFEISLPAAAADDLARSLLENDEVEPIGLGARDSLRLEAGLCLYGHDIDTGTTPVEAALTWSISPERREGGIRAGGYPGAERITAQMRDGVTRRRVGLRPVGRAPVREGAELETGDGARVGAVTSGGFGPSVGAPVAMGYVDIGSATVGSGLVAWVRGKPQAVEVCRLPFVERRYFRG